jgi:imidazolonepropionase
MQIHQAGGGINFTVEHTRNASEDQLYDSLVKRLQTFMKAGNLVLTRCLGYRKGAGLFYFVLF